MSGILLTGAAGFIGRHFVHMRHFQKRVELICVDKEPEPPEGLDQVDYMSVDLTSVKAVSDLIAKVRPDTIVHLAGSTKVGENGDANVDMLSSMITAFTVSDCLPRLVLAGSAAEYGDMPLGAPPPKEDAFLQPNDPYARSKVECSAMAQRFNLLSECPVAIMRFANVYGPGQRDRFIPLVLDALIKGRPVVLHAMGETRRQYVYVDDICRGLWLAVDRGLSGVFNLGGEEWSTKVLSQIAAVAVQDYQLRRGILPVPAVFDLRPDGGGAMRVVVDSAKAAREISWQPTVTIYEGLRRTVAAQIQGDA